MMFSIPQLAAIIRMLATFTTLGKIVLAQVVESTVCPRGNMLASGVQQAYSVHRCVLGMLFSGKFVIDDV